MVTNRKKLKTNKRRAKFFVLSFVLLILIVGSFTYLIYKAKHAKVHYLSPLSKTVASPSSAQNDKNIAFITEQLNKKKIEFSAINTSKNLYVIKFNDDSEVTLSAKKDLAQQISSLQFILSRLTMEGKQFKKLDLQFDNPIIVFK